MKPEMKAWFASVDREKPELNQEAIQKAGEILKQGGLIGFPTETVYGLGGNALDPKASEKIYAAKGRPSDNPLIVHIARWEDLDVVADEVPETARELISACWPGPLTCIFKRKPIVPLETTGGLDTVAVRFPSHPVAQRMILAGGGFIAAPSANTSGRPSPTTAQHVAEDLGERIDGILDSGMVDIGLESTIVDFTEGIPTILRPGFYTREMMEQVIGEMRIDPGILGEDPAVRPKAPGMRYRHYAPKADLTIVQGPSEQVIRAISEMAGACMQQNRKVGIICTDETLERYPDCDKKSIGLRKNEDSLARHLFAILRDFDADQVDVIFSESFDTPRLGQAIMNRLLKAAGHKVIEVTDE